MNSIKITKAERNRKQENQRQRNFYNTLTPPKLIDKRSTLNTVHRLSKKFGYDTECIEENDFTRNQRVEFANKAAKYIGGKTFSKKQTRFDKMRSKEELGFKLETNPVITKFKKVDAILRKTLLSEALFTIRKTK